MKALVPILLVLVLAAVILPGPVHAASSCSSSTCKATVDRTISTNAWGVTLVSDRVVLNSTQPVSHLTIGIPLNVSSQLRSASAADSKNTTLTVSNLGPQTPLPGTTYTALDIVFASAKTGQYTFNVTTIYTDLLAYSPSGNSFTFSVSLFPVTDGSFNVTGESVTLRTGDWPTPKLSLPANFTVTGGTYTAQATNPMNKFNTTVWKVSFSATGTSQNAFDVSAGRLITISSSGNVQVTDNYTIANRGGKVSSVAFTLPKGISAVSASDVIGPVTTPAPTANSDGTNTLTFTPRFLSVDFNQSLKVQITYQLLPSTYISSSSLGTFTLNFAAFNNVKFYEPMLTTKIVTPMGFKLNTLTGQVPQTSGGQVVLQVSPLTPSSNLGFSMTYQLSPFWASLSPLAWAGLLEAALAGSVLALWRGQGASTAMAGAPSQLIAQFVDLFDERSSLRLEEDKMEEDMNRGAMNRFDYKQRRRMMDRRMSEIDRTLAPVKQQLSSSLARYGDMIKKIERAEAELQVIKSTSADLKNQYRTGKLSKDLYESLSNDLVRRKEKAQQTIDTIVINLREEIR